MSEQKRLLSLQQKTILFYLVVLTLLSTTTFGFQAPSSSTIQRHCNSPIKSKKKKKKKNTRCFNNNNNWVSELWDEFIEFSTYGPGERRPLKAQREKAKTAAKAAAKAETKETSSSLSIKAFQEAKQNFQLLESSELQILSADEDSSQLSLKAFQAAVATKEQQQGKDDDDVNDDDDLEFDGYALRDLLMSRWGVPLDIGFQRGYSQQSVYCTVMPVVFGSRKCRHRTELDYLMHLQGVVEVLHKYGNLDRFIVFLQSTSRVPKPGIESAPYQLELGDEDLRQILGKSAT